jgi:cytochrome c biogenesis protein
VRLSKGDTYRDGALTMMATGFEPSIHNFGPGVQIAYLEGNQTQTVWFVKAVPTLREKEIGGVAVRLDDIANEFYTGLEVSHDPGIWVVWTGFALILFGLYINFFVYYRRIYLLQTSEGVLVAGTSPRNKEVFREEFEKWREKANGIK